MLTAQAGPSPCDPYRHALARRPPRKVRPFVLISLFGEFLFVAEGFHLQSYGKVPSPVCVRADAWLRRVASSSPRTVLALSDPSEAKLKKQAVFRRKGMGGVVIWVADGDGLALLSHWLT